MNHSLTSIFCPNYYFALTHGSQIYLVYMQYDVPCIKGKDKAIPLTGREGPTGMLDVEAPTFSR
jgi:hypothetical protein